MKDLFWLDQTTIIITSDTICEKIDLLSDTNTLLFSIDQLKLSKTSYITHLSLDNTFMPINDFKLNRLYLFHLKNHTLKAYEFPKKYKKTQLIIFCSSIILDKNNIILLSEFNRLYLWKINQNILYKIAEFTTHSYSTYLKKNKFFIEYLDCPLKYLLKTEHILEICNYFDDQKIKNSNQERSDANVSKYFKELTVISNILAADDINQKFSLTTNRGSVLGVFKNLPLPIREALKHCIIPK